MTSRSDLAVQNEPDVASAGGPGWVAETAAFARRNALVLRRSPMAVVQSVIFPTMLLLVLLAAFGRAVGGSVGSYAERLVPQLVISGGAFGAIGTGIAIQSDRASGLIERVRSLPTSRASYLSGAVLADAGRALVAAIILVAVGHLFGFRFSAGPAAAVAFVAVATAFGSIWAWLAIRLGLSAETPESVASTMNGPILMLFFLSTGFVPVEGFPSGLQPFVRANPLSTAVNTLIGLSSGGPVLVPLAQTAAWIVGLTALFGYSSVKRFIALGR